MKKLCIIYNFGQKYREGIYSLIEQEYDCHWCFGDNKTDIKGLDYSMFHSVEMLHNVQVIGKWYWQKGTMRLFWKYDNFLMLGELFCLSTWVMLFLALVIPKKHVYLWSHGWYGRESVAKRLMKKAFFGMSAKTMLYGNYALKMARQQGYGKDNLCVIHNSLDHSHQLELRKQLASSDIFRNHFHNDFPVLIFIGRLTAIKRLDLLVDALAKLKESGSAYNLVLVGDGTETESIRKRVMERELEGLVWFYGACYDEHVNAELIYNADLCVAPGNVGLTAMHSMVYGTPVATHNSFEFQMPEFEAIIEGKTGCFFKYEDVDSIVQTIRTWFEHNKEKRANVRQECYKEIDAYWTPQYQIKVIKSVIE